jgi:hypothetical protein
MEKNPSITKASVRVMRSHDYSHFEVTLGVDQDALYSLSDVDELRKAAARLADKAVEQYKTAKKNAELREQDQWKLDSLRRRAAEINDAKPDAERTPEEKAILKALADLKFRSRYDYEDEWQEPDYDEED